MSLSTPQQVMERLEQGALAFDDALALLLRTHWNSPASVLEGLTLIKYMVALRMNEYEKASGDRIRLSRQWDKRLAIQGAMAKGSSADVRKAVAFSRAAEQDDLYERMTAAEEAYEACRAVDRSTEKLIGIGQSILKAQGRA